MGSLSYILVVFPDKSLHPIAIDPGCVLDLAALLEHMSFDGHSLYAVYASWAEVLPTTGVISLPLVFETDVMNYWLQFFPSDYPPAILRIQPVTPSPAELSKWNIAFRDLQSKRSFDDILSAFRISFCVSNSGLEFEFEGENGIDTSAPILEQRDLIKGTIVTLKVKMNEKEAGKARQRMDVLSEILQTEKTYVSELKLMAENFNENFFKSFHVDPDVYRRTFKSITEILPMCETFLEELKKVGCAVESSIGSTFLEYVSYLKVVAPHVSNFNAANRELTDLLKTNKPLQRKVLQICAELFDGRSVESILVTPVQRIPRYPLLLKSLIEATVTNHWDYAASTCALAALNKLAKDVDETTKERKALDMVGQLQKLFKSDYQIVTGSRKYVARLDNVKTADGLEGSLYLFNDLVLFRAEQPQVQYIPFEMMSRTKVLVENGNLVVQEKTRLEIPECDGVEDFVKYFQDTKQEYMSKICTFDGSLKWKPVHTSMGPETYRSAAVTSIFGDIYLFGGRNDEGEAKNDLWWYRNGKWERLLTENPPPPRYDCSINAYEAKLIVFGGQNGADVFGDLWELDIPTLVWNKIDIPDGPSPRFAHATAFTTTQLWLFGGKGISEYMNDFYCCDLYERKWYKIVTETIPECRAWHRAFWVQDQGSLSFAMFGGAGRGSALNSFWIFDYDSGDWYSPVIEGEQPTGRYAHVSTVVDGVVYIIGGRNMSSGVLESYKIDTTKVPFKSKRLVDINEPESFEYGACVALPESKLALYGGKADGTHRGLWTISLTVAVPAVAPAKPIEKKSTCLFDSTCLSRPIFDVNSGMVTCTFDDSQSTFSFTSVVSQRELDPISKLIARIYCWKKEIVVKLAKHDYANECDNGRLLLDADTSPFPSLRSVFGRPPTGSSTPKSKESRFSTLFRQKQRPVPSHNDLSEELQAWGKLPMPVVKHSSCMQISGGTMRPIRPTQNYSDAPIIDLKRAVSCDLRDLRDEASESEKSSPRRHGRRKSSR